MWNHALMFFIGLFLGLSISTWVVMRLVAKLEAAETRAKKAEMVSNDIKIANADTQGNE